MSNFKYGFISANNDNKFYAKMGNFFASRQVRKEIGGYPLNNEDDWIWMVATDKDNIVGFICIEPTKHGLLMHDCYVVEAYRMQGVFAALLDKVIHYATVEQKDLFASVNEKIRAIFDKRGFVVTGQRGQWLTMGRIYENISK